MPRDFDGSSDLISLNPGAVVFEYGSIWMVARLDSGPNGSIRHGITFDGQDYLGFANNVNLNLRMFAVNSSFSVSTGTWYLLGVCKATGTSTTRFHKYDYSTGTWTHSDSSSAADASGTITTIYLGGRSGSRYMDGQIAAAAVLDHVVLTDAQFETMPHSLRAWSALNPTAMWVLDQADTTQKVIDWTGGGANESALTGSTVSTLSSPIGYGGRPNYEQLVRTVTTTVTPGSASLTLTGSVSALSTLIPTGSTALTLTGSTPSVGLQVNPAAASLTLTGLVPAITQGTLIDPPAASLTLTGSTPALTTFIPTTAASLALTGSTPALDTLYTPGSASLVLNLNTPAVTIGTLITPTTASLSLTGSTPVLDTLIPPGTAVLTLTGSSPALTHLIATTAAVLTLTMGTPTVTSQMLMPYSARIPGGVVRWGALPAAVLEYLRQPGAVVRIGDRPPGGTVR